MMCIFRTLNITPETETWFYFSDLAIFLTISLTIGLIIFDQPNLSRIDSNIVKFASGYSYTKQADLRRLMVNLL